MLGVKDCWLGWSGMRSWRSHRPRPPRCTQAKAVPTLGKHDKNFIWTLTLLVSVCFICLYETRHRWDDKCHEWKRRCRGAPWLCSHVFRRFSDSLVPITLPYWQSRFPFYCLPYDTGHLQMRVLNSTMMRTLWRNYASLASFPYSSRFWASRAISPLWLHEFIHKRAVKTHPL